MNWFGRYIYSVIIAALIVSFLLTLAPKNSIVAALIRLVTGIFLIMIVITPVARVQFDGIVNYISDIDTNASVIISEAEQYSNAQQAQVIKQKLESYILNIASDLDAEILVAVQMNGDIPYMPECVKIIGPLAPLAKKRLSAAILQDLGIPEESQIWILQQTEGK